MQRLLRRSLILVVPALAIYIWLVLVPTANAFRYSFSEWSGFGERTWIGVRNFTALFADRFFLLSFRNTVLYVAVGTFFLVLMGLTLALLLERTRIGRGVFRTAFFFPAVISAAAVGVMWRMIYNPRVGVLNDLLARLGLEVLQRNWMGDASTVLWAVLVPVVWQYAGLYMMIYFAGLQGVPTSLYEASNIDGATGFQKLLHIKLPLLREVTLICLVLASTGLLRTFDHIWVITQGGPNYASSVLSIYMWKEAFEVFRAGRAMAVAVLMFLISIGMTLGFRRLVGPPESV